MIGLIVAAGNQTRFNLNIPKCIMPYGVTDTLTINIKTMLKVCDHVVIAVSDKFEDIIRRHVYDNFKDDGRVIVEQIPSGKGCGHATFNALSVIFEKFKADEQVIIKWGDTIHDIPEYYDFIKTCDNTHDLYVPCEYVKNPYTSFLVNYDYTVYQILLKDEINKYAHGWHDLSIFYIPNLYKIINEIKHDWFLTENTFLKSILDMDISIKVIRSNLKSKSYNTIEEFNEI